MIFDFQRAMKNSLRLTAVLVFLIGVNPVGIASHAQQRRFSAAQVINLFRKNPEFAKLECALLRRRNQQLGISIYGDDYIYRMAPHYKMSVADTEMVWIWLAGNYCPDLY